MSKLIGTNPNQVPSNADLGSAAFMDKKEFLLSKGSSLSAIDTVIPKTARDIFIYDTSKDSDGGAWRKRTQHTSWYKERLNTTTRGSRKEFPAVAVIVVEDARFTIYDGDDPALPMWMTYTGYFSYFSTNYITSVVAKNGWIFISNNQPDNNHGLTVFSFPNDIYTITDYASSPNFLSEAPVTSRGVRLTRYSSANHVLLQGSPVGIGKPVNDVAMTVLPNAPVDAATGLPVPTIAVATDGGVSVIKDDGTVVGRAQVFSNGGGIYHVDFDGEGYWYGHSYYSETNGSYPGHAGIYSFSDLTSTANLNNNDNRYDSNLIIGTGGSQDNPNWPNSYWSTDVDVWMPNSVDANLGLFNSANGKYFSGRNGISVVEFDGKIYSHITSNYNTGYMVGKNDSVKLATLSDTDDTDVTGIELVTNGTFDTDTSGWTAASGTTLSLSSNELVIASSGSDYGKASQSITLEANTTYVFTVYIAYSTQIYYTRYSLNGTGYSQTLLSDGYVTNLGWQSVTFTTPSTVPSDIVLNLSARNDVVNQRIDNISIRKAEEDRSVNGNGLQVFGTVTKNPVASGADLVSYSGFSSSARLQQPYTSAMDFGTGDICINLWAKHIHDGSSLAYYFFDKADTDGTNRCGAYYIPNSGIVDFYTPSGTSRANNVSINDWSMITFVRTGTMSYVYINGEVRGTQTGVSENLTSSDRTGIFTVGTRFNGAEPWTVGDLSLVRVSATAPSAEQIKKIYEDEKFLFQENAKATLYGSSDAVTALAYDDSTELLHVGTSAGRSVFQGLQRIDNTTNVVGTAISAVDGFVVEE